MRCRLLAIHSLRTLEAVAIYYIFRLSTSNNAHRSSRPAGAVHMPLHNILGIPLCVLEHATPLGVGTARQLSSMSVSAKRTPVDD